MNNASAVEANRAKTTRFDSAFQVGLGKSAPGPDNAPAGGGNLKKPYKQTHTIGSGDVDRGSLGRTSGKAFRIMGEPGMKNIPDGKQRGSGR